MSDAINPEELAACWKQRVDAWKGSGLSQKHFCEANELLYHRFVYWRRKFEGNASRRVSRQTGNGFAAVVCEPGFDSGLSLSLPNGLVLRGICADNVVVVRELLAAL